MKFILATFLLICVWGLLLEAVAWLCPCGWNKGQCCLVHRLSGHCAQLRAASQPVLRHRTASSGWNPTSLTTDSPSDARLPFTQKLKWGHDMECAWVTEQGLSLWIMAQGPQGWRHKARVDCHADRRFQGSPTRNQERQVGWHLDRLCLLCLRLTLACNPEQLVSYLQNGVLLPNYCSCSWDGLTTPKHTYNF